MARVLAVLLPVFVVCVEAQAQNDNCNNLSRTPERLIGLLDLPDIVAGGCGPAPNRATTRAFASPSENGRSVGTISWREERDVVCELMMQRTDGVTEGVPTLESGYEIPAAIVFERRGSWFRIRLKNDSAWIRTDGENFLPFPEILRTNLAHTMTTWDGTLRATPGPSGRITPLSPGWKALTDRPLSFQYLGSRRVGNDVWLRIRLAAKGPCDQTYENVTDGEGWIPAYYADRTPLAWFSSRGC